MIGIILTEKDFEYELQALAGNFFPGQECRVFCEGEELPELALAVRMELKREGVRASFETGTTRICFEEKADEDRDWHKHPDKSRHPYRSHYKNLVKQTLFSLLMAIPKSRLPEGVGRIVPPWGTMTGVRPAKIPMNALLQGRDREDVKEELEKVYLCEDDRAELCLRVAEREAAVLMGKDFSDEYSLYIGIPFCPTTCLYCSFTSYPIASWKKRVGEYLEALEKEMAYVGEAYKDRIVDTVYIGGGTPTTLEPEELDRLLAAVYRYFDLSHVQEFTAEAGRADSITEEKLRVLKKHGITRISINPQTMREETLRIIGRKHSPEQVREAFALARKEGFDHINMDIILGLPGEKEEDVRYTAEEIQKLSPDSLTVHSLAIKRASGLNQWIEKNGMAALKNTDATMGIAAEAAKNMGMRPYYLYRQKNMSGNFENVGYALPGKYGIYNILIMEEMQTIAALGAGAITKRVYGDGRIERCDNVKDVALYIEKIDEMIGRKRRLLDER